MIGHMADTERIMSYRALRIARGDGTPLPGFDEGAYAKTAGADARDWPDLVQDLSVVRSATVALFRVFDADAWRRSGVANGAAISVRALGHIIVGHERHHLHILQSRYGLPASSDGSRVGTPLARAADRSSLDRAVRGAGCGGHRHRLQYAQRAREDARRAARHGRSS